MPVQFKVIDKRRNPREVLRSFEQRSDALKRRALEKAANAIVSFSPVDTGTYIMAHDIKSGGRQRSTISFSSAGKPTGRDKGAFAGPALADLQSAIAELPEGFSDVMLANYAEHAAQVEYLGWGSTQAYYVYTETRALMGQFILEAEAEVSTR